MSAIHLANHSIARSNRGLLLLLTWLGLMNLAGKAVAEEPLHACAGDVPGAFPLVQKGAATALVAAPEDAEVVRIALTAVAGDIEAITGKKPAVLSTAQPLPKVCILAGTLGHSALIDGLAHTGQVAEGELRGRWEVFSISEVKNPAPGVERALVVAGSDRRGTAYGVLELSRLFGVSPWIWWADVRPEPKPELFLAPGRFLSKAPGVKYRGIFLNDEDWGLQPWAARALDPEIADIGPKTYAHIFELLLRLRANLIFPAMHECTKAFYHYPENPATADRYAIVVGTSHAEPMLRNNVYEWKHYEDEYHQKPGDFRYDTNQAQIDPYWRDRAKQSAPYESAYTMGMRGIHDSGMVGPQTPQARVDLLARVIENQRGMLAQELKRPLPEILQFFCPYKEVLSIYRDGLKLPPDITMVWPDDNHGYIRQLSSPEEQMRPGGSGVYYHLSYWGAPEDYLWLCSTPPELISYEMTKAKANGADRVWVFNVGDIKPAELEAEFALDLAWEPEAWTPEKVPAYARAWAARTFGEPFADEIAAIKAEYYLLGQAGKPEHLWRNVYTKAQAEERLRRYAAIDAQATALAEKIPERLRDAYFQLIAYPVHGVWKMNEKVLGAKLGRLNEAKQAASEIVAWTRRYNEEIAGGKWNRMMDWQPRRQRAYQPAEAFTKADFSPPLRPAEEGARVDLGAPSGIHEEPRATLVKLKNLGAPVALGRMPLNGPELTAEQAPWVEYPVKVATGPRTIHVRCLPGHALYLGVGLKIALSINGAAEKTFDLDTAEFSPTWETNVLRGYTDTALDFTAARDETVTVRVKLLDPGTVLTAIFAE